VPRGTVVVRGLSELVRDFGRISKTAQKELRAELRRAAEPVAEEARNRARGLGLPGSTVGGIAAGTRYGMPVVRQRRRKVTGKHPEYGVLQMRRVLIPAVVAKQDEVVRRVEEMLDRLVEPGGLGGKVL